MKKIEKALLPGEKAFFPSENAHFLVESPLFFEGHKPLPWENQSNLCTGNGSLDKPHSNSLALSNGRMILNSESATKFCQINCVAVSMFYILFLWGWRARVKSRIPRNDLFFLKRLKFPEATKIIAFSRNAQQKADHEEVGMWDVILPIDELIFFKTVKTTNQIGFYMVYINIYHSYPSINHY